MDGTHNVKLYAYLYTFIYLFIFRIRWYWWTSITAELQCSTWTDTLEAPPCSNVVHIVNTLQSWQLKNRVQFQAEAKDFSFLQIVLAGSDSSLTPMKWILGGLCPGVKQPEWESHHKPPSNAKFKTQYSYISTSPYALIAWKRSTYIFFPRDKYWAWPSVLLYPLDRKHGGFQRPSESCAEGERMCALAARSPVVSWAVWDRHTQP